MLISLDSLSIAEWAFELRPVIQKSTSSGGYLPVGSGESPCYYLTGKRCLLYETETFDPLWNWNLRAFMKLNPETFDPLWNSTLKPTDPAQCLWRILNVDRIGIGLFRRSGWRPVFLETLNFVVWTKETGLYRGKIYIFDSSSCLRRSKSSYLRRRADRLSAVVEWTGGRRPYSNSSTPLHSGKQFWMRVDYSDVNQSCSSADANKQLVVPGSISPTIPYGWIQRYRW